MYWFRNVIEYTRQILILFNLCVYVIQFSIISAHIDSTNSNLERSISLISFANYVDTPNND